MYLCKLQNVVYSKTKLLEAGIAIKDHSFSLISSSGCVLLPPAGAVLFSAVLHLCCSVFNFMMYVLLSVDCFSAGFSSSQGNPSCEVLAKSA